MHSTSIVHNPCRPVRPHNQDMLMTDALFIHLLSRNQHSESAAPLLTYGFYDDGPGFQFSSAHSLAELAEFLKTKPQLRKLVLVVPGEDVLLTSSFIPTRQQRKILQAIPYVVEDILTAEIGDSHYTLLACGDNDSVFVAVTSHEKMKMWVDIFHDHDVHIDEIISETLLCPLESESVSVFMDAERHKAIVRSGVFEGFACDLENLPLLLKCLFHNTINNDINSVRRKLHLLGTTQVGLHEMATKCNDALRMQTDIALGNVAADGLLNLMANNYLKLSPNDIQQLNLRHGKYQAKTKAGEGKFGWKSLAMAALVILFLKVGLNIFSGFYLNAKSVALQNESIALYKELYPDDTRIINIRTQMENHLQEMPGRGSGNEFLNLLAKVSAQLSRDVNLQFIRYDDVVGLLTLEFNVASLANLDALEKNLNEQGLIAEITSAVQSEQLIKARITVAFPTIEPG